MSNKYKLVIFDWHGTLARSSADFFPGVIETLQKLKADGYLLAVATTMPYRTIKQVIIKHKLTDLFSAIRTAERTAYKPDPLMLNEILEELDVTADRAVMIGDTEADMHMASYAGVAAIGVSYGLDSAKQLQQAGAVKIIEKIADLPEKLI